MTTLAAVPVDPDQLDLLSLVADNDTPLGQLHRDDFERACRMVADSDGWVNPNHVSAYLHQRFGQVDARWYSAMWSAASGSRSGFLDTYRDVTVPIDGKHSRGNANKVLPMRRLREAS